MKRMLPKILIGVAALIVILLVVIAMRPDELRVVRTVTISAPPAAAYNLMNDFHQWMQWSPWEKLDPDLKRTFTGPNAGTGSGYAWTGNKKVGEGRMTITESKQNELIRINLEFIKPFPGTYTTTFTYEAKGGQTTVSWIMEGKNNFMSKAFGLFMNMDTMIGSDFEKGLAQLKTITEAAPRS